MTAGRNATGENKMDLIKTIEEQQKKENALLYKVGDTVVVHFEIIEGKIKRIQKYEGVVICIKGTENRITVARKDFNDTAKLYNQAIRQFPKNILAGMFGFEKKSYFEAEAGSEKAPKVEF